MYFISVGNQGTYFKIYRLVDGAGGIKLTKDGKVLLTEMVNTKKIKKNKKKYGILIYIRVANPTSHCCHDCKGSHSSR
jgi:hypothetical protein